MQVKGSKELSKKCKTIERWINKFNLKQPIKTSSNKMKRIEERRIKINNECATNKILNNQQYILR
jgi:hypothetical protein